MIDQLILGAGSHANCLLEEANLCGHYETLGFIDNSWPYEQFAFNLPIQGTTSDMASGLVPRLHAIVEIGNIHTR